MIAGARPRRRHDRVRRRAHRRAGAGRGVPPRHRPHLPARAPVPGAFGRGQCHCRRTAASSRRCVRAPACAGGAAPARSPRQARAARLGAHAARPQAARGRARARDRSEAAAARRGDGRPAPDRDRPHGRDPVRAQPGERPHHPADRACHARRDGARRAAWSCCITGRRSPKACRLRSCATRRSSSPISARRRSPDAHGRGPRRVSRRRPGARRRLARGRRGRDRRDRRRQRGRQDLAHPHHRGHASPGARPDRVSRPRHRGLAEPPRVRSGHRPGAGRPPGLSDAHGRGKSRHGRHGAAGARRPRAQPRARAGAVSDPVGADARSRPERCRAASSRCWRSAAA